MFGQRRERYAPFARSDVAFRARSRRGTGYQAGDHAGRQCGFAAASDATKATTTEDRVPAILGTPADRISAAPDELPCGCCGAQRIIIRTHVTKRAEMEEAKIYVVEEVRYTYGCSHCHDGSQMQTTERPPQAVEKSPFGPSILAWLVTWKFLHHLPVYRQQELLLGPLKRWLSRALLCGLLSRTAQALRPLERLIHERVLASIVINADETEVKMLKPGNGKAITGYLSGYAGDADHRYVFYDFRPSRSRDGPREMLG